MSLWNGTPRLNGVRVLLVERLLHVREVVAEALGQCGADVIAVDSAVEGLAVLKLERPDVLVSSLAMPDKDGYWLIRQVRDLPAEEGGDTPAAAFTGCTTREDRLKALRAGYQLHVPKPTDLSQLAEVVALLSLQREAPVLVH
jgi:CheY-like chemotaxis protein